MGDKINVNVIIAEKHYILKIDKDDEEIVRKAAKQVNKILNTYRTHFDKVEEERLLAMVAMHLSRNALTWEKSKDTTPFVKEIKSLTQELDDCLKEGE